MPTSVPLLLRQDWEHDWGNTANKKPWIANKTRLA
jgi:hypothetical protein